MEEKAPVKLLIVDDYPVVLSGLVSMLKNHTDIELVGVASNGSKAIELAGKLAPKVVLMNLNMPEIDGIEATRIIRKANPEINILIFSGINTSEKVLPALSAGAIGFILKDATEPDILQAIRSVARGEAWLHPSVVEYVLKQINTQDEQDGLVEKLTERELEVLRLMAKGYSNHEIARLMILSAATVHTHVSRILAKLEVSSRTQAVIYAMRAGVISENKNESSPADPI